MRKVFISILFFAFCFNVNAQFENILAAGKEDLSNYLGNYTKPAFKGMLTDLNAGWYNSKPHKKLGFDVTFRVSLATTPDKDKSFTFKNSDYKAFALANGNSAELPSVMGSNNTEALNLRIPVDNLYQPIIYDHINNVGIPVDANNNPIADFDSFLVADAFNSPKGITEEISITGVPLPIIQVGLGLPKKTDIKLRYVPSVGTSEGKVQLFGVGIQHSLLQHLKLSKIPIVDVSILGAFTQSNFIYTPKDSGVQGQDQEVEVALQAYTVQLVANANFKVVNFYAGLGYAKGTGSFDVKGTYQYQMTVEDALGNNLGSQTYTVSDPISIDYELEKSLTATVGARLNLAFFKIFADYTIQEYNTVSVGVAFSFR